MRRVPPRIIDGLFFRHHLARFGLQLRLFFGLPGAEDLFFSRPIAIHGDTLAAVLYARMKASSTSSAVAELGKLTVFETALSVYFWNAACIFM